jgi:hypothetical protein
MSKILAALKPFAKAIAPAVLGALVSLANALAAGSFNATSLKVLGAGLLSAVIAYLVPNSKPAAAPAPAPPAPAKKIC